MLNIAAGEGLPWPPFDPPGNRAPEEVAHGGAAPFPRVGAA